MAVPRIQYWSRSAFGGAEVEANAARAAALGFDHVMIAAPFPAGVGAGPGGVADHDAAAIELGGGSAETFLAQRAAALRGAGLRLLMDLDLRRFGVGHPLLASAPEAFAYWRAPSDEATVDPRQPGEAQGLAYPRLRDPQSARVVAEWFAPRLSAWAGQGLAGVRILCPGEAPAAFWRDLLQTVRVQAPGFLAIADTPGLAHPTVAALAQAGFDFTLSSLPWWDLRARWLAEEDAVLRAVAPPIAAVEPPGGPRTAERLSGPAHEIGLACERHLLLAAALGSGLLAPADAACDDEAVRRANALQAKVAGYRGALRLLTSTAAEASVLLRPRAPDARTTDDALLVLVNPRLDRPAGVDPAEFLPGAGAQLAGFENLGGGDGPFAELAPGEVRVLAARRAAPIASARKRGRHLARAAARAPRLVLERITPSVDGGAFPVKRIVGERVRVEADLFADGHEQLGAELGWRAADESEWRWSPMVELGNDRWRGEFTPDRLGRHVFTIRGWLDRFGGLRRDLGKKLGAGVAQAVDFMEGRALIEAAARRSGGDLAAALEAELQAYDAAGDDDARAEVLLGDALRDLMRQADDRPFLVRLDPPQPLDAERLAARYSSWYELFPRSMSDSPERHGTFDDVIARLPDVREMGFDTLYFPPIHPIGNTNRKGRDNALAAEAGDPGSPYAIGAAEGGHDAIHPELGTLEDFLRLVGAAREHGLEIALDFAIQCSPDHPWLKDHPGWFDWRPDGSLKYAENPPKKYQDIVNVDFYKDEAIPGLWMALRDVVAFWCEAGVRTFRVDNPHTKPLPFWEWLIGDIRSVWPDVIFLSEAFTRPAMMYRLAKVGFSQSYTYFTWRHTKAELTDYLVELTTTPVKEFYRPHFFVNTPDINPYFLQTSGRGGFLIRAALAATLSGLFGVYSGFELLESEPVPGKEEYRDSEKYEIKPRAWRQPGDIVDEIAQLNRIRRGHPALQTHLGVVFYPAFNDQVLYYGKRDPSGREMVLVAVSLDPHNAQDADIEIPLWEFGLPDEGAFAVDDLVGERGFVWRGKRQQVRLTPERPYAIWRVQPLEEAWS
ncbi:MAG: maltotransferase domain-containing protein [Phenylobacterium sp.]|uniref:maltotransferase domain-containing protein n=1 Tax=Phenylobacterium sp. TaxID=1871053 RepID=UPI0039197B42